MSKNDLLHRIGPAILVGLLAFVLTWNFRVQRTMDATSAARREELAQVVQARQKRTVALEATLAGLRSRLERTVSRSDSRRLQELSEKVGELAGASGSASVTGPAVIVKVSDAPDSELEDADFRIQDGDLQLIVNELWLAGAEAIAINGQRLVATSAIRNAGAAVLVNYRVLTSPYRVTAIGDRGRIRSRFGVSRTAKRFERWRDIYGLGFAVTDVGRARLPSFDGSLRLRHAEPIRGG